MHYTYVLEGYTKSRGEQRLYIGFTKDLANRVKKHHSGKVRTTKNLENIHLIYYEACISKSDARKRELQLKTGFGRGYIKRRLENYFRTRN